MIAEVLTNLVAPREGELETCVLHITTIDHGRFLVTEYLVHRGLEQPVLGLLHIPVKVDTELTADETGIETNVDLLRSFPCYIGVRSVLGVCTGCIDITVDGVNHIT